MFGGSACCAKRRHSDAVHRFEGDSSRECIVGTDQRFVGHSAHSGPAVRVFAISSPQRLNVRKLVAEGRPEALEEHLVKMSAIARDAGPILVRIEARARDELTSSPSERTAFSSDARE